MLSSKIWYHGHLEPWPNDYGVNMPSIMVALHLQEYILKLKFKKSMEEGR